MGGMGFIEHNKALCMLSVLINTHMLMSARAHGVERFFYSSSACIYPGYKQTDADVVALKESDAYPADAEDGYGWENCLVNDCVGTFTRILASRRAQPATTMFTDPMGPGMAAAKRHLLQYRARSRWQ